MSFWRTRKRKTAHAAICGCGGEEASIMDDAEILSLFEGLAKLSKAAYRQRRKKLKTARLKTAIKYLRVSDRSQVETDFDPEGNSIPTQRGASDDLARKRKLAVIDEYIEPGASGLAISERPVFLKMVRRIIERKDVGYVIVYKFSRGARNRHEDAIIEMILNHYGVVVLSATEGTGDGDTSNDRAMRGMIAVNNQWNSEHSGE